MNPKITITVDAKNKAIAAFDGIASVGAKVDVEVRGLPASIEDYGDTSDYAGPSLRFRILDDDGNDILRFPHYKKDSTDPGAPVGGDKWTRTTVGTDTTYTNSSGTVVDFNTEGMIAAFDGEAYDASKTFGVVLDSTLDSVELAVGKMKVRNWKIDDASNPIVVPGWEEIQTKLNTVDAKVEKPAGSGTATITITNTKGVTTTATVKDGEDGEDGEDGSTVSVSPTGTATDEVKYITIDGVEKKIAGGDMNHSEFSSVTALSNATLNQVAEKVNELIGLLKPSVPMVLAMIGLSSFGDLGPTTQFGDVPPSSTLNQVVTAGGGGGADTNAVEGLIARYDETNLTARLCAKLPNTWPTSNDFKSKVAAVVTSNVVEYSEWTVIVPSTDDDGHPYRIVRRTGVGGWWLEKLVDSVWDTVEHNECEGDDSIYFEEANVHGYREAIGTMSAWGFAYRDDVPSTNGFVKSSEVQSIARGIVASAAVTNAGAVAAVGFVNGSSSSIGLSSRTGNIYFGPASETKSNKIVGTNPLGTRQGGFEFHGGFNSGGSVKYSKLLPDGSPVATSNMVENVVETNADYAMRDLTGAAATLKSGEIGNASLTADLAVTLDFSEAANRSGDCLLYLVNATANDHDIVPTQTNDYAFVSTDLAKALTISKATTNIVTFSRVKGDTILVSKQEIK